MTVEIVNRLESPGIAGMICKRIGDLILVYGGSYFPGNDPLKSSKVQSNKISVYDSNFNLLYVQEGKIFPDKGISIQKNNELYYILGSKIYRITVEDKVNEECIGEFEFQIESGYGCYIGDKLFFGHQESYSFDLNTRELSRKADFPVEARGQGLSVFYQNELYYLGGANSKAYLDGFKYNFDEDKWTKADYELANSVLGATSIRLNENEVLVLGGFNKSVYDQAVIDLQRAGYREEYFSKDKSFFKWNSNLRILNMKTGKISMVASDERFALCGAGFVEADDGFFVVSGECSPGRRTNEVLLVKVLLY